MKASFIGLAFLLTLGTFVSRAEAKSSKVQEVNFSEVDIEGKRRNPDGAYLVQKKGVQFVPLYRMKSQFDLRIEQSTKRW